MEPLNWNLLSGLLSEQKQEKPTKPVIVKQEEKKVISNKNDIWTEDEVEELDLFSHLEVPK